MMEKNFNKSELLAMIKDYDNFSCMYDRTEHESDCFDGLFWDMQGTLYEKIESIIDNLFPEEDK
jgi:hypothetical protein